jgi:hypothetical protein
MTKNPPRVATRGKQQQKYSLPPSRRHHNEIFARKQLLLRRSALLTQWHQLFQQHDFGTGRLRLRQLTPPCGWNDGWRAAAREYHEERNKRCKKT